MRTFLKKTRFNLQIKELGLKLDCIHSPKAPCASSLDGLDSMFNQTHCPMEQVTEFIVKLFQADDWPARWVCGNWSAFHGWLYITSDIAIWLAYFVIPAIIIFFIQKHHNLPFLPVFWLFGAFIILCGSTHIIDALMFWWPGYRVNALVRVLTALVSMATAFVLIRDLPKLIAARPEDELKAYQLEKQLKKYEMEIAELKKQLNKKN